MEKINSKFHFKVGYRHHQTQSQQQATVVLEINYASKEYSIIPYCGSTDEKFEFKTASHKWKLWKAILTAIENAIDFANKELENL